MNGIYSFWGRHPLLYQASCALTFLGREEQLRRRAVERLGLQAGDTVLDLACGTGLNFPFLCGYVGKEGKVVGVDYSAEMVDAARQRVKSAGWINVQVCQQDAAELSLEHKVDGIIATLGLSAIPRHQQALVKAIESLKAGSRIVVLDAQPFSGWLKAGNPLLKAVYGPLAQWDYTKDLLLDFTEIVGKSEVEWYNAGTMFIATGVKPD